MLQLKSLSSLQIRFTSQRVFQVGQLKKLQRTLTTQHFLFYSYLSKAVFYCFQQILNSTLDHAIQTANSLKKATEKMVQAISEDLAKARRKQL